MKIQDQKEKKKLVCGVWGVELLGLWSMNQQKGFNSLVSCLVLPGNCLRKPGKEQEAPSMLHSDKTRGTDLTCLLLLPELCCRGAEEEGRQPWTVNE